MIRMCQDSYYINTVPNVIENVWNYLNALNPNKFRGPDDCHPHVLCEAKDGVVTPLFLIFKSSLEHGKLPTSWKDASATALCKSGDKCLPSNHRSVSLTSVIYKVLER